MGKVSELSQLIEELNRCGNTLIGISEDLKNLFSGSEEAKEKEPKTKVTEETPAKAAKKEKTLSLEDVRAVPHRPGGFPGTGGRAGCGVQPLPHRAASAG